jgi:hypothetical protein
VRRVAVIADIHCNAVALEACSPTSSDGARTRSSASKLPPAALKRLVGTCAATQGEAIQQRRRWEELDASCGELDRKRQAVEALADRGCGEPRRIVDLKSGLDRASPLEEQIAPDLLAKRWD